MRKILIITVFCIIASSISAQTYQYCEIVITGKDFSYKCTAVIDSGQVLKVTADNSVKDVTGKNMIFSGNIAVLNYMGAKGWEYVDALPITTVTGNNVYHFYMRKPQNK